MKLRLFIILAALCAAYPAYAVQRNLEITWDIPTEAAITPDGYRLYIAGQESPACSTDQTGATSMTCQLDLEGLSVNLVMTSYTNDGKESPRSAPFTYTFKPTESLHAAFSASPTFGSAPLPTSFNAVASTGDIDSFTWTFGDGSSGTGQSVEHIYTKTGNYTATLTITSTTGETDSTTTLITVSPLNPENHPPKAVLTATPVNGQSPLIVTFDASQSTDPDGDKLSFTWLFGDESEGTGIQTSHTYTTPGLYTATLRVTDTHNSSSLTSVPILVKKPTNENEQPVAIISVLHPRVLLVDTSFIYSGERSIPSSSAESITSYDWDFGDGTTSTGEEVLHSYDTTGEYAVTLTIHDSSGESASSTLMVRVISNEELTGILCVQQLIYRLLLKDKPVLEIEQTDTKVNK